MKFSLIVLGIILLASILAEDRRAMPTGGGTCECSTAKIGDHLLRKPKNTFTKFLIVP